MILDVTDRREIDRVMAKGTPSHVVHAAALTPTIEEENAEPDEIIGVNIGGTTAIVDAATRLPGIHRIVFMSSGAVYASHQRLPEKVDEVVPPTPDMLYGIAKLAGEGVTSRLGDLRGVSTVSVRLASVYGEMERATSSRHRTSLIHRLATSDRAVTVSSDDIIRDWVHADDVALAVAGLLADGPLRWRLFHVGGGEPVGWRRIVDIFKRADWPLSYITEPDAADIRVGAEDTRPIFSIARITAQTGYKPRSIEDGLAGLIEQGKASA
jgi:nucleoside-diphosphate-sugar epimerase